MVSKFMSYLVAGARVGSGQRREREGQKNEDRIPHDQNVATALATTSVWVFELSKTFAVERSRRPSSLKIKFGVGRYSEVSVVSVSVCAAPLMPLSGSRKRSARSATARRSSNAYRA